MPGLPEHALSNKFRRSPSSHDGSFTQGSTTSCPDDGLSIPETYNSYAPTQCICRPEVGDAPAPPESDETCLRIFRSELMPMYPFVVVPMGVSASVLRAARPFLMSAIRMVSSFRSMRSMRAQMYRLMTHVADHMLLRSERSIDLLLGIVVILGWYHHHCFLHAQMNNLISLATCLVAELGLNRNPGLQERPRMLALSPEEPRERTNEERRLLLAVWYLSSS
jgi:hypothetical protein